MTNLTNTRKYRAWQNSDDKQAVLLSQIQEQLSTLQTTVSSLTEPTVLYDATWDFTGTMVAEEDEPDSGNWYWGGYNAETDSHVFYDYGWTVHSYDRDVFEIVTADHSQYDGTYTLGAPVYKDNTGKILGRTLVLEVTSSGYYTTQNPGLYVEQHAYADVVSNALFENSGVINNNGELTDTFFSQTNSNKILNTAYEIADVVTNYVIFNLNVDSAPFSADDSFTITTPIRVRILMTPGN